MSGFGNSQCVVETRYVSSEYEELWLANVGEWQSDYCKARPNPESVQIWLDTVKLTFQNTSDVRFDQRVFSKFETTLLCGGSKTTLITWIEPLAHALRHPSALPCVGGGVDGFLGDPNYLVLASYQDMAVANKAANMKCLERMCQNIYIDLGATIFQPNTDGQGWFIESYEQRGIIFDRLLLWEAAPKPPAKVFEKLPKSLFHKYQYYNIPATSDINDVTHPVNILKQIAQPGDFVVFKLDIDNTAVETSILQALMDDATAFELLDEFIFEYHVSFAPMLRYWGGSEDRTKSLKDSYKLFYELRKRGVRSHSWT